MVVAAPPVEHTNLTGAGRVRGEACVVPAAHDPVPVAVAGDAHALVALAPVKLVAAVLVPVALVLLLVMELQNRHAS